MKSKTLEERFYAIEAKTDFLKKDIQFFCQGDLDKNRDLLSLYKKDFKKTKHVDTSFFTLEIDNLTITLTGRE